MADVLQKDIPKAEASMHKHKVSKSKLKADMNRLAREIKIKKNQNKLIKSCVKNICVCKKYVLRAGLGSSSVSAIKSPRTHPHQRHRAKCTKHYRFHKKEANNHQFWRQVSSSAHQPYHASLQRVCRSYIQLWLAGVLAVTMHNHRSILPGTWCCMMQERIRGSTSCRICVADMIQIRAHMSTCIVGNVHSWLLRINPQAVTTPYHISCPFRARSKSSCSRASPRSCIALGTCDGAKPTRRWAGESVSRWVSKWVSAWVSQ